ncbi:MAG: hypothetical protein AMXMBFR84_29200 [Candidatus Hydrogenedentota bacterium]
MALFHACMVLAAASLAQPTQPGSFAFHEGKIFLPVALNGEGPFQLVYDTTAQQGILERAIGKPTPLPDAVPIQNATLHGLKLGGFVFTASSLRAGPNVEGILPAEWLPYAVTFNFRANQVSFSGSAPPAATTDGYTIPLRRTNDATWRLAVSINGSQPLESVLDTRLSTSLALPRSLAEHQGWLTTDTPRLAIIDASTDTALVGQTQIRLSQIAAGRAVLNNPVVALTDSNAEPRIGTGFLRRFRVTIDLPAHYIRLEPDALYAPTDGPIVGVGVTPAQIDAEGYWLLHVAQGSPADIAGIRPGDRLADINRKPMKGAALDTVHELLAVSEGDKVTLGILRNGMVQHALMAARKLL